MNDDSSFTIHGDEPVEARIVSWVLGEASAFEAAELERLCEERPELLVFKRRMVALHGLLAEAHHLQSGEDWKLPPGKRKALDGIFGAEKARLQNLEKDHRIRHSGRRAFLAIAACLILTLVVAGLFAPMGIRQSRHAGDRPVYLGVRDEGGVERVPLKTAIPAELIEGTPRPINVPNLESASDGPAGGWRDMQKRRIAAAGEEVDAKLASGIGSGEPALAGKGNAAPPPARMAAARKIAPGPGAVSSSTSTMEGVKSGYAVPDRGENFGEMSPLSSLAGGGGGSGSGGVIAPGSPPVASAPERKPAAEEAVPGHSLTADVDHDGMSARAEFKSKEKSESGRKLQGLPANRGMIVDRLESDEEAVGAPPPAAQPMRAGSRSGNGEIVQGSIDNLLKSERASHGEKDSSGKKQLKEADKVPTLGDVPVLGRIQPAEEQSGLAGNADHYDTDGRLEGANTFKGSTATSSGALTVNGSAASGLDDTAANAPAKPAEAVASYGAKGKVYEFRSELPAPKKDVSDLADAKSKDGVACENHSEATHENFFRGRDLAELDEKSKPASELAEREMTRRQSTVVESDQLLAEARSASATGDYQKAYGAFEKALELLPDAPLLEERRDVLRKALGEASVELSRVEAKEGRGEESKQWLIKAREWDPSNAQARKQLIADVTSEVPASEDPYSTFSLNISDASFRVAQAALAKGEQPDPAGIKVEQFYNAVDYGDPSPSAGEPVAVNIEQSAHPVIPGRNLVRIALKTAAAGRSASQPLRLTLLVDQSGSMVREDRRAAMDKALASLSGLLTKNDIVTVIGFSRTPRLLADSMTGDQAGKLSELVNQTANEGGTNLEEAIKLGEQMAGRQKLAGAQNRIVLFTDGAANLGNADPDRLAAKVKELRQKGIAFDIAGIAADGLNDELLGELARNGNGRYYVVGKGVETDFAKQLAGAFRPAAENVKVQVHFNPDRVGRYKLIGFEKDRLKTEDFRNDKVDAAELAAEEAGVAIYQVETLPDGHGELGEVSVRFRDTAAGRMVERTWTVPHRSNIPVIDRATPSMQLAVLSMLAGEKLKGGPLAEVIDFKQLTATVANVKQFYGKSGRAGEMLRMVDVLK